RYVSFFIWTKLRPLPCVDLIGAQRPQCNPSRSTENGQPEPTEPEPAEQPASGPATAAAWTGRSAGWRSAGRRRTASWSAGPAAAGSAAAGPAEPLSSQSFVDKAASCLRRGAAFLWLFDVNSGISGARIDCPE